MKNLILAFILLCSCATMKQVCYLENQWLIVTDYHKSVKVWTVKSVNYKCYSSFTTDDIVHIGDTVRVEKLTFGSVADFRPPHVHIIEKK